MQQTENFHSHTWRCHHASGTEREYVESAIQNGMTKLGFSDHTPYDFSAAGDYYSSFRMRPEQLEGYVNTILSLKKEYAKDIEIYLGLEAEYYPRFFEAYLRLIEPYPLDYLLLGQHFLNDELDHIASTAETADEARLHRFVEQTGEALSTGMFSCFVHPDMMDFRGDMKVWESEMRVLCQNAKKAGVPLEVNLLGMRTNRAYPHEDMWRIAGEVGNDVVFGSDAHSAKEVIDQPSYDRSMEWMNKYNVSWRPASYILDCSRQYKNQGAQGK